MRNETSESSLVKIYDELDERIRTLYALDDKEYNVVKQAVDGTNIRFKKSASVYDEIGKNA